MHCPRAPTPEPSKGRRPKNRHSQKRFVKRPWSLVSCLSWFAWLGVLSRARVSGPLSGSQRVSVCFFLLFLFIDRGRHVPAPGGRGVGSIARAPTQVPVQGTDPRTGFFRYSLMYGGFAIHFARRGLQCVFNYVALVYAYMLRLPEIDFCFLNG